MKTIKLIAGPCSAESPQQLSSTSDALFSLREDFRASGFEYIAFRAGVWKPRTHFGLFEGVGEDALEWLKEVQDSTGIPSVIEVASPSHVEAALKAGIRMFWIGSRTTTNPFDVQSIADSLSGTGIPVFVKNPINPDPELWIGAVERLQNAGVGKISVIHRGFSYYENNRYRNYPKWQVPIEFKRRMPQVDIFCDPSHIGGRREYIGEIAQRAIDLGFDGLFVESHINPDSALSDAGQQVLPDELSIILRSLIIKETSVDDADSSLLMSRYRSQIDLLDDNLLDILSQRMKLTDSIGNLKRDRHMTVLQQSRWNEVLKKVTEGAKERALDEKFIQELFQLIHEESILRQSKN